MRPARYELQCNLYEVLPVTNKPNDEIGYPYTAPNGAGFRK